MQLNWVNKRIVSQYGLICSVLEQKEVNGETILTCLADYKNRIWEWPAREVSLITKENEILDIPTGEIFGRIAKKEDHVRDVYILYEQEERKIIPKEEILKEFL